MNDKWNPRLWLRDWLLKPSETEQSSGERLLGRQVVTTANFGLVNATAQGEPKAVAFGHTRQGHASDGYQQEPCGARPAWADAMDALAASDRALSSKIAAASRCPESS